ncbi:Tn5252%2C ORF 10 protein [Streptococcus suis]|uniref:Tn5252, ORF 10 protein n=2 Tax=Streptococcus suis TaxID=1307 RepID=A0A0Z8H8R6_STRSU|nr:hypothetical protein [Streptococcus suis]NQH36330.1 hypothetical protein [Streptococcus suis]CYV12805.1 Tn5252%2C ORF 10 protein [Streptococcus suis]HEL1626074.1 hypothetical protein [Streptococcus suis]HEM3213540.1 hypothetical protein [Streptococcus suis 12814]
MVSTRQKSIRKNLRLSPVENQRLLQMMKEEGETNFSRFFRKKIFEERPVFSQNIIDEIVENVSRTNRIDFRTLVANHQLEKVYEELRRIVIFGETRGSFSPEEVQTFYTLLSNILNEYHRILPLSDEFKERYFGKKI